MTTFGRTVVQGVSADLCLYKVIAVSDIPSILKKGCIYLEEWKWKIGLRENPTDALERECKIGESVSKDTHVVLEIRFSSLGVAHYTTLCQGPDYDFRSRAANGDDDFIDDTEASEGDLSYRAALDEVLGGFAGQPAAQQLREILNNHTIESVATALHSLPASCGPQAIEEALRKRRRVTPVPVETSPHAVADRQLPPPVVDQSAPVAGGVPPSPPLAVVPAPALEVAVGVSHPNRPEWLSDSWNCTFHDTCTNKNERPRPCFVHKITGKRYFNKGQVLKSERGDCPYGIFLPCARWQIHKARHGIHMGSTSPGRVSTSSA